MLLESEEAAIFTNEGWQAVACRNEGQVLQRKNKKAQNVRKSLLRLLAG